MIYIYIYIYIYICIYTYTKRKREKGDNIATKFMSLSINYLIYLLFVLELVLPYTHYAMCEVLKVKNL